MTSYQLRRGALLIVSLIIAMVLIFVLLRLLPGDPANALLSVGATPEQIAAAQQKVGSDLPLLTQLANWAGQMLRFDLGESLITGASIGPEVGARLAITGPLTLLAFVLALVGALFAGVVSAVRADRWYGIAFSAIAQIGIAVPVFWVGIILVWVFGLGLGWFPAGGFRATCDRNCHRHGGVADAVRALRHDRRAGERLLAHRPRARFRVWRGAVATRAAQRISARHLGVGN